MTAPAAQEAATREPIRAANPVSGPTPSHTNRKVLRAAREVLIDLGYASGHRHAWHLLKEFRDSRNQDARDFVIAEFRLYAQKRGDLMQVRSKRHHPWRVST